MLIRNISSARLYVCVCVFFSTGSKKFAERRLSGLRWLFTPRHFTHLANSRTPCSLPQFYTLAVALVIICLTTTLVRAHPQQQPDGPHTLLDIETPNQFSYNSPLAQPDSLRSKPYFDFLSTLYAHDSAKTNLFRNRPQRDLQAQIDAELVPAVGEAKSRRRDRKRRALVFRPLFVYQQREVRKKEIAARRRSDEIRRRSDKVHPEGNTYNQLYHRV